MAIVDRKAGGGERGWLKHNYVNWQHSGHTAKNPDARKWVKYAQLILDQLRALTQPRNLILSSTISSQLVQLAYLGELQRTYQSYVSQKSLLFYIIEKYTSFVIALKSRGNMEAS